MSFGGNIARWFFQELIWGTVVEYWPIAMVGSVLIAALIVLFLMLRRIHD